MKVSRLALRVERVGERESSDMLKTRVVCESTTMVNCQLADGFTDTSLW